MGRVVDLRLELRHLSPTIWRVLRVPSDLRLDDLHQAIQVVMGWDDYHLHVFEVGGHEYGPRRDDEEHVEDLAWAGETSTLTVAEALARSEGAIDYVYDFGDDWRLKITPKSEERSERLEVECLAGEMAGPPEDCGGPGAYQEILDSWSKNRRRALADIGFIPPKGFDPFRFSVEEANLGLREAFREKASAEFPAGPHAPPEAQLLANLTLAVLFLGSTETRSGARQAWKNVRFEILDSLQEAGFIYTDPRRKSVVITGAGEKRATELLERLTPLVRVPQRGG